ncbi:unnamed protein product [Onchocerca flexuosa]|uniref:Ribosomal_L30 domain-containing protein n=1 Tax=Onchocerca flexuosa TaxID=387005 RepID=A0A183HNT9_9BILA|nr:unnamed protein product [Onchocerca flexuosa]
MSTTAEAMELPTESEMILKRRKQVQSKELKPIQRLRKEIQLKREAKKAGNFYVPDEARLAFVIQIRDINQMHPRPRKVTHLFRLRQINNMPLFICRIIALSKMHLLGFRVIHAFCSQLKTSFNI